MLEGIAFGMAEKKGRLAKKTPIHIAFTPHIKMFLNKSSIQLQIRDFQVIDEAEG